MRRPLVSVAAVLAFFLGVIALVLINPQHPASGQEGTPQPEGSPPASLAASPAACPEDMPPGRLVAVPNEVTIHLTDEGFDPAVIQSTNNTEFTVTLVNTGTRSHAFVLDDFDVRVGLAPGESETLVLTLVDANAAVTHAFSSDVPGDECFRGRLIFYI